MTSQIGTRNSVFISYSHRDAEWLERLRVHLRPLEREYGIDRWDDTRIKPGTKWREEIRKAVSSAKVAVLLVSADFLASDFIATDELPPLLAAAKDEGAIILPVIIGPCRFLKTKPLSQFQSVNLPSKPLINMNRGKQEAVFDQVADAIETALKFSPQPASPKALETEQSEHYQEKPTASVSVPVIQHAVELSPAAIDEVVRLVIERISERVVREVAWEVVPDLAELLIRQRLDEDRKK